MRFVKFDLPNSHECVYINSPLVRTVRAVSVKNNAQSILAFDVEHSITVAGTPEETVQKLEVASVDLFSPRCARWLDVAETTGVVTAPLARRERDPHVGQRHVAEASLQRLAGGRHQRGCSAYIRSDRAGHGEGSETR